MKKNEKKEVESEIYKHKKSFKSYNLNMSFGELMNMHSDNELNIFPPYQRKFRWSISQRTRFIESIILGIPIPSIFVAENEKGDWEVVDGLQRLSTFISFFGNLEEDDNNSWTLEEGDILKTLNGLKCKDLPTKTRMNLKRSKCSVEIIQADDTEYTTRYEVFNRLNTGGTKLSDQEIRNVIFRKTSDTFNKFLEDYSNTSDFKNLINISPEKEKSLFGQELILRFFALYNGLEKMKGNLSNFLNDFMEWSVLEIENDSNILKEYENLLDRTIKILNDLKIDNIFSSKNRKGFSPTYYDGVMIGVSKNVDFYENNLDLLKDKIIELKENEEFKSFSGAGSNTKKKTIGRLKISKEIFNI
ncbi:DUF262 domain-containing protein [Methanobrevibacter arboriphilus]|uniref:DUF262 domain-containing protein n=1 Tax=Methanobrevibacter arboriphilus TaxID=39441 RepID=UPI0005B27719|nr:DUF262 domain-containing protein [Methanobrevibacter arboriphilus]